MSVGPSGEVISRCFPLAFSLIGTAEDGGASSSFPALDSATVEEAVVAVAAGTVVEDATTLDDAAALPEEDPPLAEERAAELDATVDEEDAG